MVNKTPSPLNPHPSPLTPHPLPLFIICILSFVILPSASAAEAGFLLTEEFRSENLTLDAASYEMDYPIKIHDFYDHTNFAFWFSSRFSKTTSLFMRSSIDILNKHILGYDDMPEASHINTLLGKTAWRITPKIERLEFAFLPSDLFFLKIGRVHYEDITSLVARGNYDGGTAVFNVGNHRFQGNGFYTGLLDKESAKIFLSSMDVDDYINNSYFAPPHFFFSFIYDYMPQNFIKKMSFSVIRQSDLHETREETDEEGVTTERNVLMQSLYVLGSMSLMFGRSVNFNAGLAFCSAVHYEGTRTPDPENEQPFTPTTEDTAPHLSVSAYANLFYLFSGRFPGRAGLGVNVFYGDFEDAASAMPVITHLEAGYIYNPALARLILLKAQYSAKISRIFSFETTLSFFLRLDTNHSPDYQIFSEFENSDSSSPLLGEEFVLLMLWSPLSDISISLGSGFFFPATGDDAVYKKITPVQWDVRLGLLFSF